MGTKPEDIPEDLLDALVFDERAEEWGLPATGLLRVNLAATVDWLREHPAEAARLLGTRTPTSWDV